MLDAPIPPEVRRTMHRKNSLSHTLLVSLMSLFIAASASDLHAARTCNPRDFGAKGDGATKDTAAIQKAIDACAAKGGGTVQLTAGTYLSAPIVLKSNITLQLEQGATLLGSPDHADYPGQDRVPPARGFNLWSAPRMPRTWPSPAKAPSMARAKAGGRWRAQSMMQA